jgi:AcrR family transcriptional regulator
MNKRSGIESRKKIVDAARHVFSLRGYSNANIRDIANRAGISVGGVYLYFRNKEELYKNLIGGGMLDMGRKTEKAVKEARSATEALSNFLKLYLEYGTEHKEFILLHIRERGFAFGKDEQRRIFRKKQRELIRKILVRGMRDGEFRKHDAEETAKIIQGALRGIIISMAVDNDVIADPEMLTEFALQGLLKR